jgi:hypothetical protein
LIGTNHRPDYDRTATDANKQVQSIFYTPNSLQTCGVKQPPSISYPERNKVRSNTAQKLTNEAAPFNAIQLKNVCFLPLLT